jgi:hypothetical protein
MARPNWEYIRVDVLLPEHPKIDLLTRAARWTLVELWCYCGRNRTDGIVSAARWKTFGTPAERRQIVDAGFAEPIGEGVGGGFVMHDYTEHNRSRAEIDELSARRADAGRKGGRGGSRGEASA